MVLSRRAGTNWDSAATTAKITIAAMHVDRSVGLTPKSCDDTWRLNR
jgi:hypothetical protein